MANKTIKLIIPYNVRVNEYITFLSVLEVLANFKIRNILNVLKALITYKLFDPF